MKRIADDYSDSLGSINLLSEILDRIELFPNKNSGLNIYESSLLIMLI